MVISGFSANCSGRSVETYRLACLSWLRAGGFGTAAAAAAAARLAATLPRGSLGPAVDGTARALPVRLHIWWPQCQGMQSESLPLSIHNIAQARTPDLLQKKPACPHYMLSQAGCPHGPAGDISICQTSVKGRCGG